MSDERMLMYHDYFWSSILRKGHGAKRDELVRCVHAKISETKALAAKVLADSARTKLENQELRRELLSMERKMAEHARACAPRASPVQAPRPLKSKKRKSSSEHVFQLASVDAHA